MPFIQTQSNVNIFYNIIGTGEKTVVLVHGAGATCRMWSLQTRALVKAGYRVIVYDSRGHGATVGTEGLYSIDLFADDLNELLAALGITGKVYLCGISMGGLIAQSFVLRYPERVLAVVLSNTYSFLGYEYIAAAIGADVETLKQTKITNQYVYEALTKADKGDWDLAGHMLQASEALLKEDIAQDLFFDDQVYAHSKQERIKTQAATGSFDSRDKLDQIKCPTLIIGSENDMVVPLVCSEYLHERIWGSELLVLEGANHVPTLDNYKAYNQHIIDFFAKVNLCQ